MSALKLMLNAEIFTPETPSSIYNVWVRSCKINSSSLWSGTELSLIMGDMLTDLQINEVWVFKIENWFM